MTEEHNPPAFPTTPENETRMNGSGGTGMSLRDWFAGQAMVGISAMSGDGFSLSPEDEADWAYQRADAMLAARAKGGEA